MKTFHYLVILGRQPELGLLELESRLGAESMAPFGAGTALVAESLAADDFGGVIKTGRIIYRGAARDVLEAPLDTAALPWQGGKTPFAVSVYGSRITPGKLGAVGLELKKRWKPHGSLRLIRAAKGTAVSAPELHHNRVLERGFELLVAHHGAELIVALTASVQDVDWYARRDYGRPARSASVGMLPPKLARVLVNTTGAPLVVDPFCGTGVVLQEALLSGRRAMGSDLAAPMVAASRANLDWLAAEAPATLPHWQVEQADARAVVLPREPLAIVSEGYLGPHLTAQPTAAALVGIRAELTALYETSLEHWASQLATGTEIAWCVPAWRTAKGWAYLDLVDAVGRLGYNYKVFEHVPRPVLYARPDTLVGRQLLLLRKM